MASYLTGVHGHDARVSVWVESSPDPMAPQPHPNTARVIGAIATQTAWTPARAAASAADLHTLDDGLKLS
jgi:hypothetical protein